MKILQVHNIYIGKTGEETVIEEERKVLEANGHTVIQFIKDNSELNLLSKREQLKIYTSLVASNSIAEELTEFIDRERPDICHVHNTFPIITPVVYEVCQKKGLPVVQTMHSYKMVCTNSLLFRNGEVCELCLNKSLYNSIKYKCYRNSYLATAVQAYVIQRHRVRGTWNELIDRYVCLTDFQRDKLVSGGGIPAGKVSVKPNFISESNLETIREDFFLFLGRVHDYKGLQDLLYLFQNNSKSRFVVIGKADDPLVFSPHSNVEFLGEQEREIAMDYMRRCKAVIFPSKYYEGMPMVILEAFSLKKPVISRNRGAMASMIAHGYNGLKYEELDDLLSSINSFEERPEWVEELGQNAYSEFLEKYTEEKGYENLVDLYEQVLKSKSKVS